MKHIFLLACFFLVNSSSAFADCARSTAILGTFSLVDQTAVALKCGEPTPAPDAKEFATQLVSATLRDSDGNMFTAIMTIEEAKKLKEKPEMAELNTMCRPSLKPTKCDATGKPVDPTVLNHKETAAYWKHRFFIFGDSKPK